jgi:antagonist of KipI
MFTTVQDLGRRAFQRDGVPVSGAMDAFALRAANLLVGGDGNEAGLEITLAGPTLQFESGALIALTGGQAQAYAGEMPVPSWRPIWIPLGTELRIGRLDSGCRAYLAIAGGIAEPVVLGGRSTFARAGFGGHGGRALIAGDDLPLGTLSPLAARIAGGLAGEGTALVAAAWGIGRSMRPAYSAFPIVRLLEGAHITALTADSRTDLFSVPFRVASQSDRMGYRLEGVELRLQHPLDLLSEGVAFGTMQLPPSGQPIVLMADRQTTGGYPRIGEVATVDLPLLAQLRPGDSVNFRPISLAHAQHLYLERERELLQARRELTFRHS